MSDLEIRELERRVAAGERDAGLKLRSARCRVGVHDPMFTFPMCFWCGASLREPLVGFPVALLPVPRSVTSGEEAEATEAAEPG